MLKGLTKAEADQAAAENADLVAEYNQVITKVQQNVKSLYSYLAQLEDIRQEIYRLKPETARVIEGAVGVSIRRLPAMLGGVEDLAQDLGLNVQLKKRVGKNLGERMTK